MTSPPRMDDVDLQLIQMLQMAPLISWTAAARILELSPNALAARWRRLREQGLAWIVLHPGRLATGHVAGFVHITCRPNRRSALAAELSRDGWVVSVEECASGRDLLLTVLHRDLDGLGSLVLDDLGSRAGVREVRTSIVTTLHADGSDWRLNALDAAQRSAISLSLHGESYQQSSPPLEVEDWPLIEVLSLDPRTPVAELARASGRTPRVARRQLDRLTATGWVTFRCDMAFRAVGWPILCSWLARVSPADLTLAVAELRALPQLRLCASVTGEANLVFTVFSRSLAGLSRFEQSLAERIPGLIICESFVHLRGVKRMGWLLEADGRCTGEVITPSIYAPLADDVAE